MTSCIDDAWDDYGLEFYDQATIRARKEHKCVECGETIKVGHLYEYAKGKWEGEFCTFHTCARCANIRKDYFGGFTFGRCVEAFMEEHGFDYRDGLPSDFAPCHGRNQ